MKSNFMEPTLILTSHQAATFICTHLAFFSLFAFKKYLDL